MSERHRICSETQILWRGACSRWAAKPPQNGRRIPTENRCATEQEHAPRPESWALRRLVYSPSATLPSSYESLRHCLQLRQNPPACAPCPWVLSFPCHCPSVVGLGGPVHERRNSPQYDCNASGIWHSYVMAGCARIPSGMPGSFRSGPPTLRNPSPHLLGGRR